MKGKKLSRREYLERCATDAENKAAQAEQSGRLRWAIRYRERSAQCREEIELIDSPEKQRALFLKLAAKASEFDQLAERARLERPDLVGHYKHCADDYRKQAAHIDWHAVWDDYHKTRRCVSIRLIQEEIDALTSIGISAKEFPRFLSYVVEEVLYALQDAGVRRPSNDAYSCAGFYSIDAKATRTSSETHRCRRSAQHMASVTAAEFAMRAALYTSENVKTA